MRGGYSRLPARSPARDKRGCHLGPGQSRRPRGRPTLVSRSRHEVEVARLVVRWPRSPPVATPAQAQVEIQWWHAMGGALGEWVNDLAKDFNASQKDYKVVADLQGQLRRDR